VTALGLSNSREEKYLKNHYKNHYSRTKRKADHLWPAQINSFIFCGAERGT
jgi:hypothetical protein